MAKEETLPTDALEEQLIAAWVRLTGTLKNTRLTEGMCYNEAIVMLAAYNRWREDGEGKITFKELCAKTNMLKSLVNRTIASLLEKGFLQRCEAQDKRTTVVRIVPENLHDFLQVHDRSLEFARRIAAVVGEEDARAFIRISEKIAALGNLKESAPTEEKK